METIVGGKWQVFPSRSLDVSHFVMEIIQSVEADALRLHWELNSFNFFQLIGGINAFYKYLLTLSSYTYWHQIDIL